jgi:hypothetical protein
MCIRLRARQRHCSRRFERCRDTARGPAVDGLVLLQHNGLWATELNQVVVITVSR